MISGGRQRVDIVIPHVDGDVRGYEALCRQITGAFVPCQLRDLGELRFVLRSIEKHAGWANVVLAVQSDGHVPAWLNRQAVRVVHHADFLPPELLPTFHWGTIAAHLHRISGLSEKFVLWDDDVLVGSNLRPDDLFGSDGVLGLPWTKTPIFFGLGKLLGIYQLNLEETRRALCRILGRKVNAFLYPHAPLPGTTASWSAFHDAAMSDPSFRSTVTRRSRGDERKLPTVDPLVMYANWIELKAKGLTDRRRLCQAIGTIVGLPGGRAPSRRMSAKKYAVVNDEARMRRHMEGLRKACAEATDRKIRFLNVNDDAYDSWKRDGAAIGGDVLNPASVRLLRETLAGLFPDPSHFEIQEAGQAAAELEGGSSIPAGARA